MSNLQPKCSEREPFRCVESHNRPPRAMVVNGDTLKGARNDE